MYLFGDHCIISKQRLEAFERTENAKTWFLAKLAA